MVRHNATIRADSSSQWKHLLGKSVEEIIPHAGEPFASYLFNDEEVYLFDKISISTVVARYGIIVRCDDLSETRRTLRINLSEKIPFMITGRKKITGYLKDLSIAGAAFQLPGESDLTIGSRLEISFALPLEGISRYTQISCRVQDIRGSNPENIFVVLFDHTDTPWKKQLLSRFVQLKVMQTELNLKDPFLHNSTPYPASSC
jgi:hypothetical protein